MVALRARELRLAALSCRRRDERAASKGAARTLPDLIKGPCATDGWLFVEDLVKDFSAIDVPLPAPSSSSSFLSASLQGHPTADLLPIVPPPFSSSLPRPIDRPKFHFDLVIPSGGRSIHSAEAANRRPGPPARPIVLFPY